ncbi:Retrovirus-related Pol polyprotein from transposon RE1 [Vitis vinifera]|uniref:Retrovirus-related Pol polyprotein from transposon RE1 n=1 Tax=Vitis vinifera TaxID=29760 RepID=A0A438I897_VITVI|nr:Retrovirus-related Pol polyprotein from transposon RE1 [Vitis vinifera]
MGKLQIEDRRQQEEVVEDPKKEESPLALPPPQQVQGESSQDLPKDWKFVINHPQDQIIATKGKNLINQAKYIRDLLKGSIWRNQTMKTPMSSSIKLDMDEKIQSCPKESHLSAIKRILRYLKGTMDIGLWYPKGDNFELIGYSDADFAGCKVERKNTSGTCHFLGHSLVSWHSKKQNSVALSTAEAEYIAASLWLFSSISKRLGFWVCGCIFLSAFILCLDSFFSSFASLMAPRRETDTSRAQGKRPIEPSQPEQTEARRNARSVNFSQLQHFGFEGLFGRMGWLPVVTISEPVFPTLVRAFYSRVTYELGGPVLSIVRGVEIRLSPESICRILDIPSIGLRVYEAKAWPTVLGFEPREVVQRLCRLGILRDGQTIGSQLDILPYGRFLTRAFKDAGIDLSRETDFEAPTTYDTYDEQFLGRMKFEKAPDGSWSSLTAGPSSQPSFTELPSQAPHVLDHAPWMDLSAHISSLGTRMEKLALVHDSSIYSMEDHLDQYQTGVTSQFDHFQQRFERIEECMDQ